MKQTYQLAPIPPFRSHEPPITTSTSTSSSSSTLSGISHCESSSSLAVSVDDDQAAPNLPNECPRVIEARTALTSFHVGKRRQLALEKLNLGPTQAYSLDPNGASALPPPSPLIHEEPLKDNRAPKVPPPPLRVSSFYNDLFKGNSTNLLPRRFKQKHASPPKLWHLASDQPQKSADENDPSGVLNNAVPLAVRVAQEKSYFIGRQNQSKFAGKPADAPALPLSNRNLTPPSTPSSHKQQADKKKLGKKGHESHDPSTLLELRLPLTPTTSPVNRINSAFPPTTVSARALSEHILHPVFDRSYSLGDELGSGGFGFVVQATRLSDGLLCAVKFIFKDKIPHQGWVKDELWGDGDDANDIMRTNDGIKRVPLEAYVLKTIRHRGVVAFIDLFEDSRFVYLVMEHHGTPWTARGKDNRAIGVLPPLPSRKAQPDPLPVKKQPLQPRINGALIPASAPKAETSTPTLTVPNLPGPMLRRLSCDLFECIEHHSCLSEKDAKYVFAQLVDVVGCLHYNGFVHRDIKDENIVVDDTFRVKLIDFGSALLFDYRKEPPILSRFFGTLNFAAPEILKKGSYQPLAAEIWSMGILLSILVTGESLFRDGEAIKSHTFSETNRPISGPCMDLILRCLAVDPADRWNCFMMRNHPWFDDSGWVWSDFPKDAWVKGIARVRV